MRLIRCHVDNFGKISDLDLDFTQGLNVINQPNAWGKSTLAAFLKAMFYGFDSKKDPKAIAKDRDLYRPWQGGIFGGELDFEIDGKRYRIARTFAKSEKGDEYHLYDLDTNLESRAYSSNIGAEIFDLDSSSFKRSIFIAQNDCVSESSDAINAKLGNLVENTNDINNFETAISALKDMMNSLSPDRVTGSIKRRKSTITGIEQRLKSFDSAKESIALLAEKLSIKQEQKKEMLEYRMGYAKALKTASEESTKKELRDRYEQLLQEASSTHDKVAEYELVFPNGAPSDDEFAAAMQLVRKMEEQQTIASNFDLTQEEITRYEKCEAMFDRATPTESQIDGHIENLSKLSKARKDIAELDSQIQFINATLERKELDYKPKKTGRKGPIIIATILEILGVLGAAIPFFLPRNLGLFPYAQIVGAAVIVVGLIILIVAAMVDSKAKASNEAYEEEVEKYAKPVEELETRMHELKSSVAAQEEEARGFLEQFHVFCAPENLQAKLYELKSFVQEYERLNTRIMKLKYAKDEAVNVKKGLATFEVKCNIVLEGDVRHQILELQARATEYRMAFDSYEKALEKLKDFETKNNVEELAKVTTCPYSLDELNEMISKIDVKVEEIREAIEQLTHQLDELSKQLDQKDELEQELEACHLAQEKEMHQYDVMKLTSEFLTSSKEKFTSKYMAPISNGFDKYYSMLTGDNEGNWQVDANIEVKVREHGQLREAKYFSAGYKDLLGICMRLALVDAMYQEEKPFLLLDDPFVNLDDDKLIQGKQMLEELAREYQTIYFTCHESRVVE